MGEIGRVLKPGEVAAIATEFILTDASHPEFFNFLRVHYGEPLDNVPFTSVMLFLRKPAWN